MRGVVALVGALLLTAVVPGCFVAEDDPETQSTDGTSSSASASATKAASSTATKAPAKPSNATAAPTANLTASVANGTAPLNVTFTASGIASGAYSWLLTAGNQTLGNGTTLPANVTHQFTVAGNVTVVLTVIASNGNATDNVTLRIANGTAAPPTPAGPTEDQFAVFNADGTCDAKGETGQGAYVQHRGGSSIWVYAETNDIAGLQLGGADEQDAYTACLNPDTLIF